MPLPNDFKEQRWRPFINAGATEVPAFGMLEITGMSSSALGSILYPILSARRPTSDSIQGAFINSHLPVPVGAQGICTIDVPTWVAYDTSGTPAYDEDWGTQTDSYLLKSGNTGFKIIGGETDGRVYVDRRSTATTPTKTLYLPLEDTDNYLLPQLGNSCYGYEWTISATSLTNLDTGTSYTIKDYYGTLALPGQKVFCTYSATLSAWVPIPFGQNPLHTIRVYKSIPAYSTVNGDDIWFAGSIGGLLLGDLLEGSALVNDEFEYGWGSSGQDIEADQGNPVECYAYLFHENGGSQWRIIGRACNPAQVQ